MEIGGAKLGFTGTFAGIAGALRAGDPFDAVGAAGGGGGGPPDGYTLDATRYDYVHTPSLEGLLAEESQLQTAGEEALLCLEHSQTVEVVHWPMEALALPEAKSPPVQVQN